MNLHKDSTFFQNNWNYVLSRIPLKRFCHIGKDIAHNSAIHKRRQCA